MVRFLEAFVVLLLLASALIAQTAPTTGLRDNTPQVHAFIHARIVTAPGHLIPEGTLVIRKGIVESVGSDVRPPADARVWDCAGLTLYPALIDLVSDYGMARPAEGSASPPDEAAPVQQQEKPKGAAHWNAKAKAEVSAAAEFIPDAKSAEKLRSQGFALVLTAPTRGVFRGQGALVTLGDGPGSDLILRRDVAQVVTLESGGGFFSGYPNSLMGIIAFIRQTWLDADWYQRAREATAEHPDLTRPETNNTLAALGEAVRGREPVIMDASTDMNFFRAAKIGKEFHLKLWIRGSGQEYRRIDAVRRSGVPVIVPLAFPDAPGVETPEEEMNISVEDLRHWDAAPENPGRLQKAGVPITLTAAQLKDAGTFLAQVRRALERGLDTAAALAALTTTPAQWLGLADRIGSLEEGKAANIVVADGDLFAERTRVRDVWIDGKRYPGTPLPQVDLRGEWKLTLGPGPATSSATLTFAGEVDKPTGTVKYQGGPIPAVSVTAGSGRITLTIPADSVFAKGSLRLSGAVTIDAMFGVGETADGARYSWSAARTGPRKAAPDSARTKRTEMASFPDVFPPGEFGRSRLPEQLGAVLIRNATIWTQGPAGKIDNGDMLVVKGKIVQVGKHVEAQKDAFVIDAAGKHVSPGIIDCHSHTAAASINEGGQAVTCETRIADVLEPDDIWIYRQLAGGTTMANVLHGSANPIGGQNAVVKWRWGMMPEEIIFDGAPQGVKFALGENVKQSNFMPGGRPSNRYPQTRMGVEELIRDRFKAAQDYERAWTVWNKEKSGIPPRRDLELDALAEILQGKRDIHAHCYREDEILMLIRVADEFGIHIGTLQHVLEGYKVADVLASHGIGASAFSDWWAYKIEAFDAIPGNGPLMDRQGVVVSYNSDDSQLATRLNWEAAKALAFGLSEEAALNFVTLNPARQLGIDKRVGSLEPGKDADFVIWSGSPLSGYTKCEQTWIDGRRFFDLKENETMIEEQRKERSTLVQKILATKREIPPSGAGPLRTRRPNEEILNSCMTGVDGN